MIVGTSFLFEDERVEGVWGGMGKGEREEFPLWLESPEQNEDKAMRKVGVRNVLQRWVRRKGLSEWVVDVLVKGSGDAGKWWLLWLL